MLFDTSSWIEYFEGTHKGNKIKSILETRTVIYSPIIIIAEISVWASRNGKNPSMYIDFIKKSSKILELNENALDVSGRFYWDRRKNKTKINLIDCIIYTTARLHGLVLLTKDMDFQGLPDVQIL